MLPKGAAALMFACMAAALCVAGAAVYTGKISLSLIEITSGGQSSATEAKSAADVAPTSIKAQVAKAETAAASENFASIVEALLPLAESGNAEAQYWVGFAYERDGVLSLLPERGGKLGTDVEDFENAKKWYGKAAEQGLPKAQNGLGNLYCLGIAGARGDGVDKTEGMKWTLKAADQGDIDAYRNLGAFYEQGLCTAQDFPAAIKWYRKGAEMGDEWALGELGNMYAEGMGVPADPVQAAVFYELSSHDREQKALKRLDPASRAEAERRILDWQHKYKAPQQ